IAEQSVERGERDEDQRRVIAEPVHAADRLEEGPAQHSVHGVGEDREIEVVVEVVPVLLDAQEREQARVGGRERRNRPAPRRGGGGRGFGRRGWGARRRTRNGTLGRAVSALHAGLSPLTNSGREPRA